MRLMSKILATTAVVLMSAGAVTAQVQNTLVPKIVDYQDFSIGTAGGLIVFVGAITPNVYPVVKSYLDKGDYDTIGLNSEGGYLEAGLMLGSLIEDYDLKVLLIPGALCLSACAFATMAADEIENYGVIGFHSHYQTYVNTLSSIDDLLKAYSSETLILAGYANSHGYSNKFLMELFDKTDRSSYIVFSDVETMRKNAVNISPDDYTIMTSDDISKYVKGVMEDVHREAD